MGLNHKIKEKENETAFHFETLKQKKAVTIEVMITAFRKITWQRSTLPHSLPCSTIDAKELNCRVRDGYGCDLFAIATRKSDGSANF